MILCNSYNKCFGVGVSCHSLYSIDSYLYVSCSGSITSVWEERTNLYAIIVYLLLCGFCSERFPLGAWDGLRYFILALPEVLVLFVLCTLPSSLVLDKSGQKLLFVLKHNMWVLFRTTWISNHNIFKSK